MGSNGSVVNSTKSIHFTVQGKPVPKGRPRLSVSKKTGKSHVYTPATTKSYESMVGWAARAAMQGSDPLLCKVAVKIDLYHCNRLDIDNGAKSIMDGMNQICFKDDDQVVELTVRKFVVKEKLDERAEVEMDVLGEG